jgi:hypothetical protein
MKRNIFVILISLALPATLAISTGTPAFAQPEPPPDCEGPLSPLARRLEHWRGELQRTSKLIRDRIQLAEGLGDGVELAATPEEMEVHARLLEALAEELMGVTEHFDLDTLTPVLNEAMAHARELSELSLEQRREFPRGGPRAREAFRDQNGEWGPDWDLE